ncbi:DUF3800 domain-containing protein [Candidatus Parcubacteria bacterium]|nr:DUF3800 domain-containing protein [Candidatus Parcubacteria bacterium]
MSQIYNIYCDETNHLENAPAKLMGLGAVWCPMEEVRNVNERVRELKKRHGLSAEFEIKWTKVSPAKLAFYQDVIDYFFDNENLNFRVVILNKDILDHKKFNQNHDDFYYKMYYELLRRIIPAKGGFNIYVDIKDTRSQEKIDKLHEVICNYLHDFEKSILKKIQQVRSHEINILQLADLLLGSVQFANRSGLQSPAKLALVEQVKKRSGFSLTKKTWPSEEKFNIFHWTGNNNL